jgi:NAD(P)H-dependent FMN reductase
MLEEIAGDRTVFEQYDISLLPFFNPDLDNEGAPQAVTDFRDQIRRADAVIICTPEYVYSLPGVLKNALEWTVSSSSFSSRPVALIVAATGGEKAYESLQLIMRTIEARFEEDTCLLLQGAKAKIADTDLREKLKRLFDSLLNAIDPI